MQEDKEAVFDALETVEMCLDIFAPMINTMRLIPANMYRAAQEGFINATDLADYLTKKGMPFRSAYKIVGQIVAECIEKHTVLDKLTIEEYRRHTDMFEEDLYGEISLEACVAKRISEGGTSVSSVEKQIALVREEIKK
ncbi:MAG: argininosuccinate lyase, partial [Clostridia bacterium]|nr:argininosuccinate lyase [Clostridia bacterium]